MHFDDRAVDAVFEQTLSLVICHHSAASLHILKEQFLLSPFSALFDVAIRFPFHSMPFHHRTVHLQYVDVLGAPAPLKLQFDQNHDREQFSNSFKVAASNLHDRNRSTALDAIDNESSRSTLRCLLPTTIIQCDDD